MSNTDFSDSSCVVLTLEPNDLPVLDDGQHITLVFLGGLLSVQQFVSLSDIISDLAKIQPMDFEVIPKNIAYFGPTEDAVVLTFDPRDNENVVGLREDLLALLPPDIFNQFKEAETFPDYKPHMTLGYKSDGFEFDNDIEIPDRLFVKSMELWNGKVHMVYPLGGQELAHIGVLHKSGRYPWGSGEHHHQRSKEFLDYVDDLRKKGVSDTNIAKGLGIFDENGRGVPTTEFRAINKIAKDSVKANDIATAQRLKDKGLSNVAIGHAMGKNESSVRALLAPGAKDKADQLDTVSSKLRDQVDKSGYIDVGKGTENHLAISSTKLATAVSMLREEGYTYHYINVDQLGTGNQTKLKVLAKPGVTWSEVNQNKDKIRPAGIYSNDGGITFKEVGPPKPISSKRVGIKWAEDGGTAKDGVIELRRGVDDISLGNSKYAQVRIAVDGTHYLKGMAMYSDHLPDGVDMQFNTNKSKSENGGDKLKAMKKVEDDPTNPFKATTQQKFYRDKNGKEQQSVLNIVNEEGAWDKWSKNLSSQFLSKQSPILAKQQLDMTYENKKLELDDIKKLTNPAIKKKLLESYADSADSSAVHLKAAGLPRTATHVILPIPSLKENEIYAPNYNDGEKVVLVRHPHGGIFEIPELTVNNRSRNAKSVMGNARDAVGIHPKVAEQLSGADFDGDTVLVIPNNSRKVQTKSPLKDLKGFDPKSAYPKYEGMKVMSGKEKQNKMGVASNLITDMTIKGASDSELARAVKYSMVVIDAEKHELNHQQARKDLMIGELQKKYQRDTSDTVGADTLISKASSRKDVPLRKLRPQSQGGPIDKETGRLVYVPTGESYVNAKGKTIVKTERSTKMAETNDARTLSSGQPIEAVYATHANKLKALANEARKEYISTKPIKISPSAKSVYAPQVVSLKAKLDIAYRNAPLERQAQLIANTQVNARRTANPDMDNDELKKIKGQELEKARKRVNAKKTQIDITDDEWKAIQSGAISNNFLTEILANTDVDKLKERAMPRDKPVMTAVKTARAKSMLASGYTQAEIASALGVPRSTLSSVIGGTDG